MQLVKGTELKRGDYQIIEVLGQGGFGITYLAYQTALGRKVAIKEFFMKEHCNRESDSKSVSVPSTGSKGLVEYFKKKFLKEALLIASFNNARIIRIYDVFEENGTAYYVMEYLEGESLKEVVDNNGALPEDVAVKYIRQAAEALSAVHAHNLLHLDVKPANIMLDENCNAVLIDFGVSKHYDEKGAQTSSAGVGLSEGYAPLEQYETGLLKEFTPATDIYALGATLFMLLTGTCPPKASIVNDSGLPPMPTAISAPVRKAVEKAMQPRRKDRPQSIEEFVELLNAPKPKLPTRKFPWMLVLLLLAVGAVAGGFMLFGGGNVITDSVVDSVNNLAVQMKSKDAEINKENIVEQNSRSKEAVLKNQEDDKYLVEPSAMIRASMMNVLYAGFSNPISISVPGVPANRISATISKGAGSIKSDGKGGYIVVPTKIGEELSIGVTARNDAGKSQSMGETVFRVCPLPDPTPFIEYKDKDGNTQRYRGGIGLRKQDLMRAGGIVAAIDDGLLNIGFKVLSFETVFYDNMGNAKPMISEGTNFSSRQKEMLRDLGRGKRFYISHVKAVGPDNVERLLLTTLEVIMN